MNEGHFSRHIRRMRAVYLSRQRALVAAVRDELADFVAIGESPTGMHLIAWLRSGLDDRRVSRQALRAGIEAPPLSLYTVQQRRPPGLVLGYGAVDEVAIVDAVRRLRIVLRESLSASA
jgi:GntR family transcriptional regulator/MocR family aminotransferase